MLSFAIALLRPPLVASRSWAAPPVAPFCLWSQLSRRHLQFPPELCPRLEALEVPSFLVVEGLARPRDIQADNTITSGLLAEAKIQFNGAGVVGDKQGPGVVHRVMDHAWPF